jgi:hypothetical protein
MAEDAKQEKEILAELKKDFPLTKESKKAIDLSQFSSFRIGDNFKITYAWRLTNTAQKVNFIKYRNSLAIPDEDLRYAGICIQLDHTMPAFTIRANTTGDKFLNLYFPDSVKVKTIPAFNHRYILESTLGSAIEQTIGVEFFNLIMMGEDLNVEVTNNKCLIYGLKPFSYIDCKIMFQLAKEIIERNSATPQV